MSTKLRCYQDETDYWRIRTFLREVFIINQYRELNWQAYRFDYFRWHVHENIFNYELNEVIYIWEDVDGQIASVLTPENKGEAFLQVHPYLLSEQLEVEMLEIAEENLSTQDSNGKRKLRVWANAEDEMRREILSHRGYVKQDFPEFQRRRSISDPIPELKIDPGYTIRSLGENDELPSRSWASWRAFHPQAPDKDYQGWDWYLNVQRAPLYRRDLDIVAVAPGGEIASFCTAWFDDVTRSGAFEPVGTVPDHQRRGLGKAVMTAGMQRLKQLGALRVYVNSYADEAHALYESAGFTQYDLNEPWVKEW